MKLWLLISYPSLSVLLPALNSWLKPLSHPEPTHRKSPTGQHPPKRTPYPPLPSQPHPKDASTHPPNSEPPPSTHPPLLHLEARRLVDVHVAGGNVHKRPQLGHARREGKQHARASVVGIEGGVDGGIEADV